MCEYEMKRYKDAKRLWEITIKTIQGGMSNV